MNSLLEKQLLKRINELEETLQDIWDDLNMRAECDGSGEKVIAVGCSVWMKLNRVLRSKLKGHEIYCLEIDDYLNEPTPNFSTSKGKKFHHQINSQYRKKRKK
ncbi:hypothetical protein [Paremcibacter congregatus]|uniref:hypothetical protein n=1 Tax=Paremcibacter congregatus TaxID=2043170 RepID=UPI0030EEEADA|tara:strand:+ start:6496 stop:6804 length:309 start_codon:yes stop_codon:yes gene_type:complete